MAELLLYTDNGDGTASLDNDPVPDAIIVARVPWTQMVEGELPWATVTDVPNPDPDIADPIQILTIEATNADAVFRWTATGPGHSTFLDTVSWV